jgi:hypothetical protein
VAYLATCTFDLKNASRTDYQNAYSDLERIGLKQAIVAESGTKVVAPTTMTIGTFNGQSAGGVRDHLVQAVKAAFAARRFSSEIFITVGGDWAWGSGTT